MFENISLLKLRLNVLTTKLELSDDTQEIARIEKELDSVEAMLSKAQEAYLASQ